MEHEGTSCTCLYLTAIVCSGVGGRVSGPHPNPGQVGDFRAETRPVRLDAYGNETLLNTIIKHEPINHRPLCRLANTRPTGARFRIRREKTFPYCALIAYDLSISEMLRLRSR